jgi:precorrin-2 dehydrogenase/sirohydrochlorin ferrochelatase
MSEMYPIFLKLEGRPVLVVGAGRVAYRKVEGLLAAEADVRVVAPQVCAEIQVFAHEGRLVLDRRDWRPADCDGALLVIAATGDSALNATIRTAAREAGAMVNAVDDPANCDFFTPAIARVGQLLIAVSTQGHVPLIAARVRDYVQKLMPGELAEVIEAVAAERKRVLASQPDEAGRLSRLREFLEVELSRRGLKL